MDTNWDRLSVRVRFTQTPSYDPNENPSDCVNLFIDDNNNNNDDVVINLGKTVIGNSQQRD